MLVVEGNSQRNPCSTTDLTGHVVITTKTPTDNTDYQCVRDLTRWQRAHPVLCYKWNRGEDVWTADYEYWDTYFRGFDPYFADPSSGTCAIFCVIERWQPETIGVIGLDWVLDGHPDWTHDAEAERKCILSLVNIVDLRNGETIRGV